MTRKELEELILNKYSTEPDYPWITDPDYAVYRHRSNRKWFALIMNVSKDKLGLEGHEMTDIVNLKCDPVLSASLRATEKGIFPAYHMSKSKWITVLLDGSVDDALLEMLLDMSYSSTAQRTKQKNSDN